MAKQQKNPRPKPGQINWAAQLPEIKVGLRFDVPSDKWEGARRFINNRGFLCNRKKVSATHTRVFVTGVKDNGQS